MLARRYKECGRSQHLPACPTVLAAVKAKPCGWPRRRGQPYRSCARWLHDDAGRDGRMASRGAEQKNGTKESKKLPSNLLSNTSVECRVTDNGTAKANIRSGHGLEIVEALAKELSGKIRQHFGPGGSTSTLSFPYAPQQIEQSYAVQSRPNAVMNEGEEVGIEYFPALRTSETRSTAECSGRDGPLKSFPAGDPSEQPQREEAVAHSEVDN
jgi:hypothetical protein